MFMGSILTMSKTKTVLQGRYPEERVRKAFENVVGDRLVSMRCSYDETAGETTVLIYPCRVFTIGDKDAVDPKVPFREARVIHMVGKIPEFSNFYEHYWLPVKKRAHKTGDDIRYVRMPEPICEVDKMTGATMTTLFFAVEGNCKVGHDISALDSATDHVCESLRLIASDIKTSLMASARLAEEVSTDLRNELQRLEEDEAAANYR